MGAAPGGAGKLALGLIFFYASIMDSKMITSAQKVLGKNLLSVLEYHKYHQSILVFVLGKADFLVQDQLKKILKERRYIFLIEDDLLNGTDVFPLDFLHIKQNSTLLKGKDYFSKLRILRKDVRHKLEFELRNKLIYLREQYLRHPDPMKFLLLILPTFVVLLDGLLFLGKKKRGADLKADLQTVSTIFEVDLEVFELLQDLEHQKIKVAKDEVTPLIQRINDSMRGLLKGVNSYRL